MDLQGIDKFDAVLELMLYLGISITELMGNNSNYKMK